MSVATVHYDAEGVDVSLRERVDLKPRHEALVVAFTDCPPVHDSTVVVGPLIMSEREFLESSGSSVFEKTIVARTLATWYAADGSVACKLRTHLLMGLLYLLVYVLVSYSPCQ